jgi:putative ATPase subunit gpP of terminase
MPAAIGPPEYRQRAKILYLAGHTSTAIASHLGVTREVVAQWASRDKWIDQRAAVQTSLAKVVQDKMVGALVEDSERTRKDLSRAVTRQAASLSQVSRVTLGSLRSTPARQGLAAVTKTVVDTAAALYGWNADKTGGHLMFNSAKEIEASVVQEAVSGAADTTTGSVQAVEHRDNTGVISQVVDTQQK